MKLYEIVLPEHDNLGKPYLTQHGLWQERALVQAGGYTELPLATGMWFNHIDGAVYQDKVITYHIACEPHIFLSLVAEAFKLFNDQKAIFTAEIGEATIYRRPSGNAL